MRLLIVVTLLGCALSSPAPDGNSGEFNVFDSSEELLGGRIRHVENPGYGYRKPAPCKDGQRRDALGNCVEADVSSKVFIYSSPKLPALIKRPSHIPKPKIVYSVVFVQTPERPDIPKPIVVGPSKQNTLVYVLTKNEELEQELIRVSSEESDEPHVYFVNYKDGENPTLAGDITLDDILSKGGQRGGLRGDDSDEFDDGVGHRYFTPHPAPIPTYQRNRY